MLHATWLLVRARLVGRRGEQCRGKPALLRKAAPLRPEELETRVNPTPFTVQQTLVSLSLNSGDTVSFNTDTGQYAIDGVTQPSTGALSPDPGQTLSQ
jgi:hypothetical protein